MPADDIRCFQLSLRLYPVDDDDLLRWLHEQDDYYGAKTHAIKRAWRRGIEIETGDAAPAPILDLAEMRNIVEAAVTTAMGRFDVSAASGGSDEDDGEAEQLLDNLFKSLILED